MGLYDIFARGLTGIIVILVANFFGTFNLDSVSKDDATISVLAILVAGYFCGLMLKEISYIREKLLHTRNKISKIIDETDHFCLKKISERMQNLMSVVALLIYSGVYVCIMFISEYWKQNDDKD